MANTLSVAGALGPTTVASSPFQSNVTTPNTSTSYTNAQGYTATPNANATPSQISAGQAYLNTQGYQPVQAGGPTATSPVVTSGNAQADFASKQAYFQNLQTSAQQQAQALAVQQSIDAQNKAQQDQQALAQKNVQVQQQQAQQALDQKNTALGLATQNSPTTQQNQQSSTSSTQTPNQSPTGSIQPPTAPNTDVIQGGINQATNQYLSGQQDIQAQRDALNQQMTSQLNQLLTGTLPLSAPQQALVTSMQANLTQNEQYQSIANSAYTGAVTESMARSGGEYTPQQSQAEISNAITSGVSKIQALDNSAAQTMAQIENQFQTQDFSIINKQFDVLNTQINDKASALQDTFKTVTTALTDQRNYAMQVAQFQQTQYKDAAQLAQSNLEFRDAHDQFGNVVGTAIYDKSSGHLLGSSGTQDPQGNPQPVPTVQLTDSGAPEPTSQAAFLATIPQPFQALVKQVANYQQSSAGLGSKQKTQIDAWAAQYDPTYSASQYTVRQALQKNFTSGSYSQNINSLNTAVGHMIDLTKNFSALGNVGPTAINYIKNGVESALGVGKVVSASTNINASVGELAGTFKSGGATDTEIKNLGSISTNSSPDQMKAYVQTGVDLLASRLNALEATYTAGMGKPPATSFLSPQNQAQLSNLKNQGYQINIPGVNYTDPTAYAKASPDNAQALQSIRSQFPELTPAQALQLAQAQ